jgi:hypothetical protein
VKGFSVSTMRPSTTPTPTVPTIVPPTTALLDHCGPSRVHLRTSLRDWWRRSPCRGTRNRRNRSIATESWPGCNRCRAKGLCWCTSDGTTVPARGCHRSALLIGIGRLGRISSHPCSEASHSTRGSPTVRRHSWLEGLGGNSACKVPIELISCCFVSI